MAKGFLSEFISKCVDSMYRLHNSMVSGLNQIRCRKLVLVEEYIYSYPHDLLHVLDLIRVKEINNWSDEEIARTLVKLAKEDRAHFAEQGTYPIFGGVNRWTDEEWKEAQKPGNIFHGFLKSNYRSGVKKKELESIRLIMRLIQKEISSINLNWGYFYRR